VPDGRGRSFDERGPESSLSVRKACCTVGRPPFREQFSHVGAVFPQGLAHPDVHPSRNLGQGGGRFFLESEGRYAPDVKDALGVPGVSFFSDRPA